MWKLIGVVICLIFIATIADAAPVGNIASPSVLKKGLIFQDQQAEYGVIAESENDFTFDAKLKDQYSATQYQFYGGKLGLLLMDRYIVYGLLGAGEALMKFNVNSNNIKWDTDYGLVWGLGGTIMLYETKVEQLWNGTLRLGLDGRYRQSDLDVDKVTGDTTNFNLVPADITNKKFELQQWQVAFALSYQVENIIPYVGVKYSDATGEASVTAGGQGYKVDFENEDNFGIFTGADVIFNDVFSINCEGRFIDETAVTAGAKVRF